MPWKLIVPEPTETTREERLLLVKEWVDNVARQAMYVSVDDAVALVAEIDRTEALMPLLDPTGYRQIQGTAPAHKAVAEAFLAFRRAIAAAVEG